jgi:hypothetical protein
VRRRAAALPLAAAAVLLAAPAAAPADDGPGVQIGGTVPSTLGLTVLDDPDGAAPAFHVQVTSTADETQLLAADGGGAASLEVAVAGFAFQPLGVLPDPLLQRWTEPIAARPVTVTARRRADAPGQGGGGLQTILITVASSTP